MIRILIVEDDADINRILTRIMQKQGYEVVQAFSGTEAWLRLSAREEPGYSLILLDLMLPGMMGEELLSRIREKSEIPVIVLSARTALEDRVGLLELGADDYLTKPFAQEEVVARVNRALHRYRKFCQEENNTQKLTYRNLELFPAAREVRVKGQEISLTAHEYEILLLLLQNPGKVFSREGLYEQVWQGGYYGEDNTVNVHVSNLRKKIGALDEGEYIKTVWGIGFKMA